MRIVHSITRLEGGPGVTTPVLAAAMEAKGHEVSVLYGSADVYDASGLSEKEIKLSVPWFFVPEMKRNISPRQDLAALLKILKYFEVFKPDVVHTHESKDGTLGRIAAILCRVPVIMRSYHGLIYYNDYFGKKTSIVKPIITNIERFLNRSTDCIISLSDALTDEIVDDFRLSERDRVAVVPNYYDLEPFYTLSKTDYLNRILNIEPGKIIITCIANLQPPKQHSMIIEAFSKLVLDYPEAQLVLVGEGPLRKDIEKQIETYGLGLVVHLMGFRTDIPAILSSTELFVMGSKSEGTPGAMIQALAAGCRVVGTAVGGIPELLEHGEAGTLCSSRSADELYKAMKDELSLNRDHEAIRERCVSKYDVHHVSNTLLEIYESILRKKKGM
ncbi:glycosyltransferase [Myxococcota bacterium]|nr:glycosyltransferase [Myxococcota bacterium]MBU1379803.1 glycosyltransferase [Myxococcota bacterium]MBU1497125.1 glycosyltransferase [Myxococcota bacterium]